MYSLIQKEVIPLRGEVIPLRPQTDQTFDLDLSFYLQQAPDLTEGQNHCPTLRTCEVSKITFYLNLQGKTISPP